MPENDNESLHYGEETEGEKDTDTKCANRREHEDNKENTPQQVRSMRTKFGLQRYVICEKDVIIT